MASEDDWFAPKRFGFGSGLPIAWQGWAVLAGYAVVMIGTALGLAGHRPVVAVMIMMGATAVFALTCGRHTRGGWRWRWGDRD